MKLDVLSITTLITIFQSAFMALVFFFERRKQDLAVRLFALLLFTFSIMVTCTFMCNVSVYRSFMSYHKVIFLFSKTSFLVGSLLFFYVCRLLDSEFKIQKQHLVHFSPFAFIEVYSALYLSTQTNFIIWYSPLEILTCELVLVQNLIYIGLIFYQLKKYQVSLRFFLFHSHRDTLSWVRMLFSGFILLWIFQLQSFILLQLLKILRWCGYTASLYFVMMFIFIHAIAYMAWKKPLLLVSRKKYNKSGLNDRYRLKYQKKLIDLMESETLYADPLLNSQKLAERLSIPVPYLSQIINESFQTNYYHFVNQYRVEASKHLLSDPDHRGETVLEIAYQVGFNSKSTFNAAFKRLTSQTPVEYRNRVLNASG